MYPTPVSNRPELKVWEQLHCSPPPKYDKDIVRVAVWSKLPVGVRLRNWKPNETLCPLVMQPETIEHSLRHCPHLPFVFDTVDTCFLVYEVNSKDLSRVQELLDACPGDARILPPGILAWSGILVSWTIRCKAKY